MKTQLYVGVAFAALVFSHGAYAQSTGAVDFDEATIVVTAASTQGIAGIQVPDTSKSKAVLTDVFIQRQAPGASINDIINQMPGVSFSSNDPFGSSGGSLNIRGFDASRISQTFDGIPLNDSGNYAIYGNQQLDPELIDSVSVNLGSGDVDSPSAGATGSTVNYRSHVPDKDFGAKVVGSVGDFGFFRIFGLIDTGEFTSFGTRAYFAASHAENYQAWNRFSKIDKDQYNARIYQPLGDNGDFISLAGHYNVNRNNFQGSVPLRTDLVQRTVTGTTPNQVITTTPRNVGVNATDRYPLYNDEAFYNIAPCTINSSVTPGVADVANTCGSTFDERYNPSNTGNIRGSARFTLRDGLVLTVDPSYQYVKANGGGTVVAQEAQRDVNPGLQDPTLPFNATTNPNNSNCNTTANSLTVSCQTGYWGGVPYFGRDLNGDGDRLDTIRVLAPSQTGTARISLIASLRWDISESQTVRLAYTYDRARHRQTGETIFLTNNGKPMDVFAINNPLLGSDSLALQKRDRLSYAILHKVSADYRGKFFDDKLVINLGVGAPFFRRNLTNNCATSSASGFVECGSAAGVAAFQAGTPNQTVIPSAATASGATCTGTPSVCTFPTQGPQQRVLDYNKILPSAGFTFEVYDRTDVYGSYSKNIQVPGTDNLYNAFYFPAASEKAQPKPEETDNFDLGLRYRSSKLQWQIGGWYTIYTNRLASSYDPDLDKTVYRNLGKVIKYGWDGSISYSPIPALSLYAFGSYLHSKIENDVEAFRTTAAGPLGPIGTIVYAPTAGKRESNAPVYTFGGGANLDVSPFSIGFDIKQTGPRYIYDTNEPVRQVLTVNGAAQTFEIYPAKTPAYTLVDLNARVNMEWAGLNKSTYFQFNVRNVFNNYWVGSINSGNGSLNQGPTFNTVGAITNYGAPVFTQIGYPRTFIASFVMGF
ncbi:MAG: TonB-dependent receptor [Sphingomonadales bacterium]